MIKPAMTPEGIDEEQCKIRTYRNLVPAHKVRLEKIKEEMVELVNERHQLETSLSEMKVFLLVRGETPLTIEEWRRI